MGRARVSGRWERVGSVISGRGVVAVGEGEEWAEGEVWARERCGEGEGGLRARLGRGPCDGGGAGVVHVVGLEG